MFKNTFQSGFLSILYSIGSKPLQIWDKKYHIHHVSCGPQEDTGDQTAFPCHDHQKLEEIFYL
uniref:Cilia and flagella associated protein 20 n=1 Tax=Mus musculus TaxID=10090 RepID=A0A1D5RLW3_MOUSE